MAAKETRIYTGDLETDPFRKGRHPRAFAAGIFTGTEYKQFWNNDQRILLAQYREYIEKLPPAIIYFHNGGRFDFFYLMEWVAGNSMRVVNSRVIKSKMKCARGWHDLRDSYAIMPVALGAFKGGNSNKKEIDITKLERKVREQHKTEILEYLREDCVSLWERCTAFIQKFGPKLTIGATAIKELEKLHEFYKIDAATDKSIRDKYYYGGRVECFESGIISGPLKVYDVNSMYPSVMRDVIHPLGAPSEYGETITEKTCFVSVEGYNYGAFPMRTKEGLRFDIPYGVYHVSIHEYNAAIETGLFKPTRVERTVDFEWRGSFTEFVNTYYSARMQSREIGDAINEMFYKLILNSAYGKFGQNPDFYKESLICRAGYENGPEPLCTCDYICNCSDDVTDCDCDKCKCGGWSLEQISTLHKNDLENFWVWVKPASNVTRFNVCTGASITGASRALLMRGLAKAKRPVYCDTDSIICEDLSLDNIDPNKLGSWKLEAEGNRMCIGGKKLYAIFDDNPERCAERVTKAKKKIEYDGKWQCVKKANKGINVAARQIRAIAEGRIVSSFRDAPSFKIDGSYDFISRRARVTGSTGKLGAHSYETAL